MNDQDDLSDQSEGESFSYSAPSGEPLSCDTSEPLFDADFQVRQLFKGWLCCIVSIHQFHFLFCLLPAVSPRSLLPQPRNLLSTTQLTSWVWTLTLKQIPRLHPLLAFKVLREEWKRLLATATSSMTCLRPLLAKQPQCRKTCSSVNQPMRLQAIQHVSSIFNVKLLQH